MADPYGLEASGLPPEIAAGGRKLTRQQAIAQAMMQQAMQPLGGARPAGRLSVAPHWLEGAAKLAQTYAARGQMDRADQGFKDLGNQYQTGLAEEVKRITALRQGQPIMPDPQEIEQSQDQGTPEPRVGSTGDPRGAVQAALMSQYGPVREMGKLDFQADLKTQENAAARLARLEERGMILDASARNEQLDRESKERIAKEANAVKTEIAELKSFIQGGGGTPYFTPVPTPNGIMSFDNRKGTAAPLTVDGKPVVRSSDSPALQGDIAGAKATGKAKAERQFNMAGIGSVIKQAEDILGGKTPPTGSGLGSLVDKAAGFIGVSPKGAAEAQKLKAVAGALTAKMPRMEGPQSDRDTALYREMAAEVGNESVPVDRRVHALQAVKNLWAKYEHLNPEAFDAGSAPGGGVPQGVDPALWEVMTPEDRALWRR